MLFVFSRRTFTFDVKPARAISLLSVFMIWNSLLPELNCQHSCLVGNCVGNGPKMVPPGKASENEEQLGGGLPSPLVTPQKIREWISEGIASEKPVLAERKDLCNQTESPNGSSETESHSCEKSSRDAFFSRLETYTSLKWAGMPHELSPLTCAQYGWTNIDSDMLKCSSCQALLCMTIHPSFDFNKYTEKCKELKGALQTAHERFCFWPDSPCPERFWIVLVNEPQVILSNFLERFQSLCQLEMQLPSLKPEDLKSMALTEDTVSLLLHLIEVELGKKADESKHAIKFCTDNLQVHVAACILSLCGWCFSTSSGSMHLSIVTCSRCMRKVGLWSLQQIESTGAVDPDTSLGLTSTPVTPVEGRDQRSPSVASSARRMSTRSRDSSQSTEQQPEKSPSPVRPPPVTRMRSWDGSSDTETVRSRPVTRSMGQGEIGSVTPEVPACPYRRAKRIRLCSSSSSASFGDSATKLCFDPLSQHRGWCPWVNITQEPRTSETGKGDQLETSSKSEPGWRRVLNVLLAIGKASGSLESDTTSVPEKSRKVFRIFHQWQAMYTS